MYPLRLLAGSRLLGSNEVIVEARPHQLWALNPSQAEDDPDGIRPQCISVQSSGAAFSIGAAAERERSGRRRPAHAF